MSKELVYSDSEAFKLGKEAGYEQAIKDLGFRKVEDELPKKRCKVYVIRNGEPDFAVFTGRRKDRTFITAYLVRHCIGTCLDISENGIEFKKDIIGLSRKDITSEVTHWMPIVLPNNIKED